MDYIIHSSALIALSYIIYRFFLSKETFYHLNRWVLLSLVILSFLLPFITVPENLSFKNTSIEETTTPLPPNNLISVEIEAPQNVDTTTEISDNNPSSIVSNTVGAHLDWKSILLIVYVLGILVFGVHFLIQLGVLLYRILKNPTIEVDNYKIIETNKNHAPYSFWNRIFMNPSQYNPETYLQILKHEQMHIKGRHTIDMLFVELLVMLQWFNPFAWLYRKAIDNNLEYLTDNSMLTIGEDKELYQMNLLKVSTPNMPTGLATSYNQSFLKKRILMMNSKKSTAKSGWKYLIIIPVLALTVFSFNPVQPNEALSTSEAISTNLNIDSEKSDIASETKGDFTKGVWDAEVGGGKLCIMYRSAEPLKRNYWSTTRCYDPSFFANFPKGNKQELKITQDAGTMTLIGEFNGRIGDGRYTFIPNTSFISALKEYGLEINQNDLVHCFLTGFDTNYLAYLKKENLVINQEDFKDIIHKALPLDKLKMYRKELPRLGYKNYTMKEISKLNLFDVDVDYISFINKVNNQKTSLKKITKAKIHSLTPEFIKSYSTNGYKGLSLDEYMKLKIHNVTPDFIDSFKQKGYTNITVSEAKNLKIHNVTPAYINSFKKAGYPNISLQEAKKLKIHDVTPELIKAYKKAGQSNISLNEAIKLKIHDVTPGQVKISKKYSSSSNKTKDQNRLSSSTNNPGAGYNQQQEQQDPNDFMKDFKALGYDTISVDDMISLKIHNVTPEFIKKYNAAGYKNIPLDKAIGLKIHNVTPEFMASYKKIGYDNISLEQGMSLKIHNVSPAFISEYKKMGYSNISISDLMSLKIHNVSPEYLKNFKKTKFGDLPLDDIISFKIHNVTPEFVKSFEDIGFKNITASQAQSLKIHNVTPEYAKELKEQDKNISLEQVIRIKIHF